MRLCGCARARAGHRTWIAIALMLPVVLTACDNGIGGLTGVSGSGIYGTGSATPGQIRFFTVNLSNDSGGVVKLESATLLPLRGFAPPRLVRIGVEPENSPPVGGFEFVGSGWPPGLGTVALRGFHLSDNHAAAITYGVSSSDVGNVAAAGVRVLVSSGSRRQQVNVYGILGVCVAQKRRSRCPPAFRHQIRRIRQR